MATDRYQPGKTRPDGPEQTPGAPASKPRAEQPAGSSVPRETGSPRTPTNAPDRGTPSRRTLGSLPVSQQPGPVGTNFPRMRAAPPAETGRPAKEAARPAERPLVTGYRTDVRLVAAPHETQPAAQRPATQRPAQDISQPALQKPAAEAQARVDTADRKAGAGGQPPTVQPEQARQEQVHDERIQVVTIADLHTNDPAKTRQLSKEALQAHTDVIATVQPKGGKRSDVPGQAQVPLAPSPTGKTRETTPPAVKVKLSKDLELPNKDIIPPGDTGKKHVTESDGQLDKVKINLTHEAGVGMDQVTRITGKTPMSIEEMLALPPKNSYLPMPVSEILDPTQHAISQLLEFKENEKFYPQFAAFVANPEIADYIAEQFHVDEEALRGRPALQIVPDINSAFIGQDRQRYLGKVHQRPSSSLFFVLENGTDPLASIGFNQFDDGVEIRFVQGVVSSKIAKGTFKDLDQLGDWRDKLVALVEKYAEYSGLKYSMILPAEKNRWGNGNVFTKERAAEIYDEMAERRGYIYNSKLGRYVKDLTEPTAQSRTLAAVTEDLVILDEEHFSSKAIDARTGTYTAEDLERIETERTTYLARRVELVAGQQALVAPASSPDGEQLSIGDVRDAELASAKTYLVKELAATNRLPGAIGYDLLLTAIRLYQDMHTSAEAPDADLADTFPIAALQTLTNIHPDITVAQSQAELDLAARLVNRYASVVNMASSGDLDIDRTTKRNLAVLELITHLAQLDDNPPKAGTADNAGAGEPAGGEPAASPGYFDGDPPRTGTKEQEAGEPDDEGRYEVAKTKLILSLLSNPQARIAAKNYVAIAQNNAMTVLFKDRKLPPEAQEVKDILEAVVYIISLKDRARPDAEEYSSAYMDFFTNVWPHYLNPDTGELKVKLTASGETDEELGNTIAAARKVRQHLEELDEYPLDSDPFIPVRETLASELTANASNPAFLDAMNQYALLISNEVVFDILSARAREEGSTPPEDNRIAMRMVVAEGLTGPNKEIYETAQKVSIRLMAQYESAYALSLWTNRENMSQKELTQAVANAKVTATINMIGDLKELSGDKAEQPKELDPDEDPYAPVRKKIERAIEEHGPDSVFLKQVQLELMRFQAGALTFKYSMLGKNPERQTDYKKIMQRIEDYKIANNVPEITSPDAAAFVNEIYADYYNLRYAQIPADITQYVEDEQTAADYREAQQLRSDGLSMRKIGSRLRDKGKTRVDNLVELQNKTAETAHTLSGGIESLRLREQQMKSGHSGEFAVSRTENGTVIELPPSDVELTEKGKEAAAPNEPERGLQKTLSEIYHEAVQAMGEFDLNHITSTLRRRFGPDGQTGNYHDLLTPPVSGIEITKFDRSGKKKVGAIAYIRTTITHNLQDQIDNGDFDPVEYDRKLLQREQLAVRPDKIIIHVVSYTAKTFFKQYVLERIEKDGKVSYEFSGTAGYRKGIDEVPIKINRDSIQELKDIVERLKRNAHLSKHKARQALGTNQQREIEKQ